MVGDGLLVGERLLVGEGLLVGEEPPVWDGVTRGDVVADPTGDGRTVGARTGIGCVALALELGNSPVTGSVGAGLRWAAGGAGAVAGEVSAGICSRGWPTGPAATLFAAAAPGRPELVGPAR
jgi:hypothetical protein